MITTVPTAGAPTDRVAALARRASALLEWKLAQEARAEARFHRRRRQARRKRHQLVTRSRTALSRILGGWR